MLPLETFNTSEIHSDLLQLAPEIGKQLLQQTELGDIKAPTDLKSDMWCTHTGLCQRGCTETSGCAINKETGG